MGEAGGEVGDIKTSTSKGGAMEQPSYQWTADEVMALNHSCAMRLEVIDGELLAPEDAPPSWEKVLRVLVEELRAAGHPYLVT